MSIAALFTVANMEVMQMSTYRRLDKQNVVYTTMEHSSALEKDGDSSIRHCMDRP